MPLYVHERADWPAFRWDAKALAPAVARARAMQAHLLGRMAAVGFDLRSDANFETMTTDVLRTSAIEGEVLDPAQVRSSLAKRLGLDVHWAARVDRHVHGVVEMLLDATRNCNARLTTDRLFGWHAAMFPTGRSGMLSILVGQYRDDSTGPMQVVSGPMGREKVHYQAPAASRLKKEMAAFLKWVNAKDDLDPLVKAALGHFWFVTLHPFEDGNGRMARAVADLLLMRCGVTPSGAEEPPQRFYSMSAQILKERKKYYDLLERSQRSSLDVTEWLLWFMACLQRALAASEEMLASVLHKHQFWQTHAKTILNPRQVKVLTKLFDGFEGNLTSGKYAKLAKTSQDTASRDLSDLVAKKVLKKGKAGGRSTHFVLVS